MWGVAKHIACPRCGHSMLHSVNDCDRVGHVKKEHYECLDCGNETAVSMS